MRQWLALLAPALALVACNAIFGIEERDVMKTGVSEGGAPDAAVDSGPRPADGSVVGEPSCVGKDAGASDGGACTFIPTVSQSILVDGVGAEYCDLVATTFAVTEGALVDPPNTPFPEKVRFFVAGTPTRSGIAFHVHVDDDAINVGNAPGHGDSVGILINAGPDAGPGNALAVIVAPPATPTAEPTSKVVQGGLEQPSSDIPRAARLVSGGYEVEVFFRKSDLVGGLPLTDSTAIRFDLVVTVSDHPTTTQPELTSYFAAFPKTPSPAPDCPNQNVECAPPRWCTSKL